MIHRTLRLLLVATVAGLGFGCFVLDELDSGAEELKRYGQQDEESTTTTTSSTSTAQASSDQAKIDLDAWWQDSKSVTSEELDASITQCLLNGNIQFMRIDDCRSRGGEPR